MKRSASIFASLALGLLLGFLGARFRGDGRATAREDGSDAVRAADTPTSSAEPAAEPGPARAYRLPGHPVAPDPAAPAPASAERAPAPVPVMRRRPADDDAVRIPRKFFSKIQCQVFNTASNCVTDDIVELLGIAPEERERLDGLITATRTRIEANELERAVVTEQSPTRVVLKIAASPDAGRDAENGFVAGVQEMLGERAVAFLERAQVYNATLFSNFGRNDTTLTVTRDPNSSLLRVESRQDYATAGGKGYSSSTTMSDQMPERWKKFFQSP
ncbi:MAG: hypothetical protein WCI17_04160 [bacterium]